MKILDAGCGSGEFLLGELSSRGRIFGIDSNERFIEDLRIKSKKYGIKCKLNVGEIENLPYNDDFFDEVHCYHVLEHVKDYKKSLKELMRVLKKEGVLFIAIPHKRIERIIKLINPPGYFSKSMHRRIINPKDLITSIEREGFEIKIKKNRGFFKSLSKIMRFLLKIPFESQSGKSKEKNLVVSGISIIDFFIEKDIRNIRRYLKENKMERFDFLIVLKLLLPLHFLMRLILPNDFYVKAVKK